MRRIKILCITLVFLLCFIIYAPITNAMPANGSRYADANSFEYENFFAPGSKIDYARRPHISRFNLFNRNYKTSEFGFIQRNDRSKKHLMEFKTIQPLYFDE